MTYHKLKRKLRERDDRKQDDYPRWLGVMGDETGTVEVPSYPNHVWIQFVNQPKAQPVYNSRVALQNGQWVWVGYDPDDPSIPWQVLESAKGINQYIEGTILANSLPPHAETHRFFGSGLRGGTDPLWVEGRQVLPFRITASDMSIYIYRGVYHDGTRYRSFAPSSATDLTSLVPSTAGKSLYALITLNDSGSYVVTAGSEVTTASLDLPDIPTPPSGTRYAIGAIRLTASMDEIYEARTLTDIFDGRFPMWHSHVAAELNSIRATVATDDVTNPPTLSEINTAFGTAATVGAGYLGILNDNGAGSNVYAVASDGANWWYQAMTKAT